MYTALGATPVSFGIDGTTLDGFHLRRVGVRVTLAHVDNHGQHLCCAVIGSLDAAIAIGVVGASRNFLPAVHLVFYTAKNWSSLDKQGVR